MNQNLPHVDLGFTEETLPVGTHMCMIYSDDKERMDMISKFLDAGIKAGEKVVYLVDSMSSEAFKEWLADKGVQVPENAPKDQLSIEEAEKAYMPSGEFGAQRMVDYLRDHYIDGIKAGFPNVRGAGETSWVAKNPPGSEQFLEYEAALNKTFIDYPMTAICQYNAAHFSGAMILNVLKVHPMMIINGQVFQNPYYLSPDEFMKSYKTEYH